MITEMHLVLSDVPRVVNAMYYLQKVDILESKSQVMHMLYCV